MARVMVIDTDRAFRDVLVYALERKGWRVACADDGAGCLRMLDKDPVEVVIVDILAPCMEDFKLLRSLRTRFPALPVIVLSVSEKRAYGVEALVAGARDVVLKPFPLSTLEERLAAVTKGKPDETVAVLHAAEGGSVSRKRKESTPC